MASRTRARRRKHELARVSDIPDGTARGFLVDLGRTARRIIVYRRGEDVLGFADACPHMGVPLPWEDDDYMSDDGRFLRCANHGALFDLDGKCVFGPCRGEYLPKETLEVVDGVVFLVA